MRSQSDNGDRSAIAFVATWLGAEQRLGSAVRSNVGIIAADGSRFIWCDFERR